MGGVVAHLTELRTLAEAATPGPWRVEETHQRYVYLVMAPPDAYGVSDAVCETGFARPVQNTAFIAACDPQTVLALVRVAEAAQRIFLLSARDDHADRMRELHAALEPFAQGVR